MGVGPLKGARRLGVRWGELRALIAVLSLVGCSGSHVSQPVTATELTRIAREYQAGFVRLRDGTIITRDQLDEAELRLEVRPCPTPKQELARRFCSDANLPIEDLSTDPEHLTSDIKDPWPMRGLRVSDVEGGSLELELSSAPYAEATEASSGRRPVVMVPTFGVGVTLFGPAIGLTFTGQWFAMHWLVLEFGLVGGGGFDAFAGFKLRPGPPAPSRIWFGAAIGALCGEGVEEPEGADTSSEDAATDQAEPAIVLGCATAATLRIGIDWTWDRGRWQVSPELDLLIPTDSETDQAIGPWAGVSVSRLF